MPLNVAVIKPEVRSQIRLNAIIYGVTGVGKTYLLGTANESQYTSPTLLVDIEGGVLTLSGLDIDVVRPKNFHEIQDVYNFLRNENTKYKSVCVDSLTELQKKLSLGEIMGKLDEDSAYSNIGEATPPNRQDWLRSGEHMRTFIRAFRDLSYNTDKSKRIHVFMTALEKTDEEQAMVFPNLPGLLGKECGAFVDILARLSIQIRPAKESTEDNPVTEEARHLLTQTVSMDDGNQYLAKNRGGKLGRGMWNPTIEKIIRKWAVEPK